MKEKRKKVKKTKKNSRNHGGLLVCCDENGENIDRNYIFGEPIKAERPIELSNANIDNDSSVEENSEVENNGK